MARILFYLVIKPLSLLPLWALHLIADSIGFLLIKVVPYRKQLVKENISNSFPDKSPAEIKAIINGFYHHMADLIFESIKIFSISKEEARSRCRVKNPEVLDRFFAEGKNVIVVGGHYNNWEMLAVATDMQVKHQIVGIYSTMSNKFFNKKFAESRSKFGLQLVPKEGVKDYFKARHPKPTATIFGADQSPHRKKKHFYWTTFLNQDTAVQFGTEKYAVEYNYPVVFVEILKPKRGYYEIVFTVLEEDPRSSPYGSITERHTKMLEEEIKRQPAYYLWTHRRWKIKKTVANSTGKVVA